MNALYARLNAFRLQHGRLVSVLGLIGSCLVAVAAGDYHAAGAALIAAFGLHHSPPSREESP